MITLFRSSQKYSPDQLKEVMLKQIKCLPDQISPIGKPVSIMRYEFPCESIDLNHWLGVQDVPQKIYWSDRNNEQEVAAVGIADMINEHKNLNYEYIFAHIHQRISQDNPHLRYYGGMDFSPHKQSEEWNNFGKCKFVAPRFELFRDHEDTYFALNISPQETGKEALSKIIDELKQLRFDVQLVAEGFPELNSRQDQPSTEQWTSLFKKVMDQLGTKQIEKLVLARKSILEFNNAINPITLTHRLKSITPDCFHFCFQTNAHEAFIVASPERLYKRSGTSIESEAIAGTKPRGLNPEDDFRLEDELLNSPKNAREHQYVVDAINKNFNDICEKFEQDDRSSLLKLKGGHHLITRFNGQLKQGMEDKEILTVLHPTPAVAGSPLKQAMEQINTLEPFHRGWYSGPVGYIGANEVELIVAIRSGLVQNNLLNIYAGAGIVSGSTAEDEWNEIEHKVSTFLKVLDHDNELTEY